MPAVLVLCCLAEGDDPASGGPPEESPPTWPPRGGNGLWCRPPLFPLEDACRNGHLPLLTTLRLLLTMFPSICFLTDPGMGWREGWLAGICSALAARESQVVASTHGGFALGWLLNGFLGVPSHTFQTSTQPCLFNWPLSAWLQAFGKDHIV